MRQYARQVLGGPALTADVGACQHSRSITLPRTEIVEHTFIVLFSIASIVAIAVSHTRIPYTVALVAVGLVVGSLNLVEPHTLTKSLLFALFLPGLVFEAAYNIHIAELRRSWRTVTVLAGPGVIVAIIATGLVTSWVLRGLGLAPDFTWRNGLVFAALVSADPIAVVSLFRKLGVDARLTTLVEAESLFNDGTSIVALGLILTFVTGGVSNVLVLAGQFVLVVCGGAVIGGVIFDAVGLRAYGVTGNLISATVGAVALIFAMRVISGQNRPQ